MFPSNWVQTAFVSSWATDGCIMIGKVDENLLEQTDYTSTRRNSTPCSRTRRVVKGCTGKAHSAGMTALYVTSVLYTARSKGALTHGLICSTTVRQAGNPPVSELDALSCSDHSKAANFHASLHDIENCDNHCGHLTITCHCHVMCPGISSEHQRRFSTKRTSWRQATNDES